MSLDKKLAAENIRARLEKRIASILGCNPQHLPRIKLGTLAHFVFLLEGDQETLGGFHTTMRAFLSLVGFDLLWDVESKEEDKEKAPERDEVVN